MGILPTRPRPDKGRSPALDTWRAELAAGKRTRYTFDALWQAACAEMNAAEAEAGEAIAS